MSIQRRQILQSATLAPLLAAMPYAYAQQVPPLSVGVNRNIVASPVFLGAPQNVTLNLGVAYLYTNGARGVFIDVVPQPSPTPNAHAGICFNASPRQSDGSWQPISSGPGQPVTQVLWYNGVGVFFTPDRAIHYEQWFTDSAGKPAKRSDPIGSYPANTVLRVTATTDRATGRTILAVYSLNGSGQPVALLASTTLTATPVGDRAGVFAIGGGNIQVQPYAIYP